MKNFVFVVLAFYPLFLKAQFGGWTPIYPLTDSSYHNRNACLVDENNAAILFWDQELDNTSTQLCYRILFPAISEMQVALMQPGVKLTNPNILDVNQSSSSLTDLKIFYQTNEGNDIDLKYITFKTDGSISEPEILSGLPGDDVNLSNDNSGMVVWENSGKIWLSQFIYQSNSFSIPFAVDSAGAYSPVFSSHSLTYLKSNGDSTYAISVYPYLNQGKWVFNTVNTQSFLGLCSLLTINNQFAGINMCLQSKVGTNPSGLIVFDDNKSIMEYLNSPTHNYKQPAICDFMLAIKKTNGLYFLAYVSDSLTQNEVLVQAPMNYPIINISQWEGEDRNPNFFITFPEWGTIRVNLLWESIRQGFSTIYGSHFDYSPSGLKENQKTESISVNPCPFNRETTIRLQASGNTKIRILDMMGQDIKTLNAQKDIEGWQKAVWDGTNNKGSEVPSGSYIIVCHSGDATQSRIIIKE